MINNDTKPISYEEYDKNHYKIVCTDTYFCNYFDHSKLNDGHYFIRIVKSVESMSEEKSPLHVVAMRVLWSDSCDKNAKCGMIPVVKMKFGKDSEVYIPEQFKQYMEGFNDAKYWQVEVLDQDELYVFTSPKKPKLICM